MVYIKRSVATNIIDVQKNILNFPNVITLVKTLGEWDELAIIPLTTFDELFEIEKEFATIKGIKRIAIKVNPAFPLWPFDWFAPHL